MEQARAIDGRQETFEQFMAGMQEFKKRQEETARQFKESGERIEKIQAETARHIKETGEYIKATGEQMKETDKRIKSTDEQIKAIGEQIKATDAQIKAADERIKATDERIEKIQAETARQLKENGEQMKETDRQFNKRFGELTNRFGDMVEYMVRPNLVSKFKELGFTFTKANRTEIDDDEHEIFLEVDALLENGDKVMAVEIKSKPNINDIHDHIERMEKLRVYADLHNDKRVYLGAVAGVVFSKNDKIYALKKGLYVIEPSGETFDITAPEGDYHPHEW